MAEKTMDNNRKFCSIVATILGIREDQVTEDLRPEDVDTWDSLNQINLLGALEQEFGITITTDNLADSQSIPKLRALLTAQGVKF
jgi:acyl carrier protein